MLRKLISHGKKKNLAPPTHLDDQFKSIDNTELNIEKRFLSFQSILHDEVFSEYANLIKMQKSYNHMVITF